jgi:hypothetical protein
MIRSHENGDLERILKAAPNRAAAPQPPKNLKIFYRHDYIKGLT